MRCEKFSHISDPLYVIAVISNPRRYCSRYELYKKFEKMVNTAEGNPILYTVELAFGDRPFVVTDANNPRHIQLRTLEELWHKENLINIGFQRLPSDWKYAAWIDADVSFARSDWVQETLNMLQHHHVVQMFSQAVDLGPNEEMIGPIFEGFMSRWFNKENPFEKPKDRAKYINEHGHCGFAWAWTREACDTMGGMFDSAILGAGDRHAACCFIGTSDYSVPEGMHKDYQETVNRYAKRAKLLHMDAGYCNGLLLHHFHGRKKNRFYHDRWQILVKHQFSPIRDMYKDSNGLWRIHDDLTDLRDDLRKYFMARNEDSIDL